MFQNGGHAAISHSRRGETMNKLGQFFCAAIFLTTVSATPLAAADYDIVIMGGRVIDPETGLDEQRNIGILNGKIIAVTADVIESEKIIDASGLVVSPGFIDLHAHGQTIPAGRMQAMDGVTTGLELEAGVLPVNQYYEDLEREGRPINYGASVNWAAARIATHLDVDPHHALSWFFDSFKNPVWQNAISTEEQLSSISRLVAEGLDQGGLGVGFLLGYAPGTGRKEYYRISKLAAGRNMPTFTHARFLSMLEPGSSFEGISEIISVAAGTNVHAHIVHLNSISLRDIDMIKQMIMSAQNKSVKITTEAYPYGAGATGIGAAMFRGPNWRERTGGMTANNFDVGGKRLTEEEFSYLQKEKPGTPTIIHFLDLEKAEDQAKLDASLLLPGGIIASDGGPWQVDGMPVDKNTWPIPAAAWSHPRGAGTYARFLRRFVRETGTLSLLEAIERVSFGPAKLLQQSVPQMRRKGRIQVGADADIVVFDLANIADRATYAKPAQTSAGIHHVIVNGTLLVEDGQLHTDVMPGLPIRNAIN